MGIMLRQEPSLQARVHISQKLANELSEFYGNDSHLQFLLYLADLLQNDYDLGEGPIDVKYNALVKDVLTVLKVPDELQTYKSACSKLEKILSSSSQYSRENRSSNSTVWPINSLVYEVEPSDRRGYKPFRNKIGKNSSGKKIIMGFKRDPRNPLAISLILKNNLVTLYTKPSSSLQPLSQTFGLHFDRGFLLFGPFTDMLVCAYDSLEQATDNAEDYFETLKVA